MGPNRRSTRLSHEADVGVKWRRQRGRFTSRAEGYPRTIRHTAPCHLLRAGLDINAIRTWLGHASLEKTSIYAEINLDMEARSWLSVTQQNQALVSDERTAEGHRFPESHAGALGLCCGHLTIIPAHQGPNEPPQHNGVRHIRKSAMADSRHRLADVAGGNHAQDLRFVRSGAAREFAWAIPAASAGKAPADCDRDRFPA